MDEAYLCQVNKHALMTCQALSSLDIGFLVGCRGFEMHARDVVAVVEASIQCDLAKVVPGSQSIANYWHLCSGMGCVTWFGTLISLRLEKRHCSFQR